MVTTAAPWCWATLGVVLPSFAIIFAISFVLMLFIIISLLVVNRFRPMTPDIPSTVEVMGEIEAASHLHFTGIVNNSNLGAETTAADVLSSVDYAAALSAATGLSLVATTVADHLYPDLEGQIDNLFPLTLQQNKPF